MSNFCPLSVRTGADKLRTQHGRHVRTDPDKSPAYIRRTARNAQNADLPVACVKTRKAVHFSPTPFLIQKPRLRTNVRSVSALCPHDFGHNSDIFRTNVRTRADLKDKDKESMYTSPLRRNATTHTRTTHIRTIGRMLHGSAGQTSFSSDTFRSAGALAAGNDGGGVSWNRSPRMAAPPLVFVIFCVREPARSVRGTNLYSHRSERTPCRQHHNRAWMRGRAR